jgi:methylated-DNA-[protein]-cysteine S-methyltransferase
MESPVGLIRLVTTANGLAAILWEGEDYRRTKLSIPERDDNAPVLLQTEQQLGEYFNKKRTIFNIPLDLAGSDFQKKIWQALSAIPFGVTKTYGELAHMSGDIKAIRAVGGALNKNPVSIIVPCHRIIGASGKLGGFAGGPKNKLILLGLEDTNRTRNLFNQ